MRNWDYRYTWIRDTAFEHLCSLADRIYGRGCPFMGWLEGKVRDSERAKSTRSKSCTGSTDGDELPESSRWSTWKDIKGRRPVRDRQRRRAPNCSWISTVSFLDSVYLVQQARAHLFVQPLGSICGGLSTGSARTGNRKDDGIWEVRSGPAALCVLEADVLGCGRSRASGSADKRSFPRRRAAGSRFAIRSMRTF